MKKTLSAKEMKCLGGEGGAQTAGHPSGNAGVNDLRKMMEGNPRAGPLSWGSSSRRFFRDHHGWQEP
jgi:hypothetical protein